MVGGEARSKVDLSGHRITISGPVHSLKHRTPAGSNLPARPVPVGVYIAARATILSPLMRTQCISHHASRALLRGIPRLAGYN